MTSKDFKGPQRTSKDLKGLKMISKYFTCVLSGIRTQVAAKTGTDQTIFDSAQLEVRDSDSGSFDDCDCDPKH